MYVLSCPNISVFFFGTSDVGGSTNERGQTTARSDDVSTDQLLPEAFETTTSFIYTETGVTIGRDFEAGTDFFPLLEIFYPCILLVFKYLPTPCIFRK